MKQVTKSPAALNISNLPQDTEILVPDLNADRKLAVVSLDVLKYLTSLLPTANLESIKNSMFDKIGETTTIEEYVECLTQEIDFHKSVNMVQEFFTIGDQEEAPMSAVDTRREADGPRYSNDDTFGRQDV